MGLEIATNHPPNPCLAQRTHGLEARLDLVLMLIVLRLIFHRIVVTAIAGVSRPRGIICLLCPRGTPHIQCRLLL